IQHKDKLTLFDHIIIANFIKDKSFDKISNQNNSRDTSIAFPRLNLSPNRNTFSISSKFLIQIKSIFSEKPHEYIISLNTSCCTELALRNIVVIHINKKLQIREIWQIVHK
ncbi:unnamed protein product, partial [Owenia fusiformis]